jgi:uncharacterized membrane protein
MRLERFWRHVTMSPARARRAFPPAVMEALRREIAAQEKRHRGELCFIVEAELTTAQLWADVTPRQRARELFALHGVWNTEENNGVLVYLLLADRSVQIVADRGIERNVGPAEWRRIAHEMEERFRAGRFEEGAVAGVRGVSDLLATHYPAREGDRNEIPDRPLLI